MGWGDGNGEEPYAVSLCLPMSLSHPLSFPLSPLLSPPRLSHLASVYGSDAPWKYVFLNLPIIVLYSKRFIVTVETHYHTPVLVLNGGGRRKGQRKE